MRILIDYRFVIDVLVLVCAIAWVIIVLRVSKRVDAIESEVVRHIDFLNNQTYHRAKLFITMHMNRTDLSEYEKAQLEIATKTIKSFENAEIKPKQN